MLRRTKARKILSDKRERILDRLPDVRSTGFDLDAFVRMLTLQGQLCLVASPLEPLPLSGGALSNSRRGIYGNYVGSRSETVQMLDFAATHGVKAVVDVMPLDRVNEAIERLRRREVATSVVLVSEEP